MAVHGIGTPNPLALTLVLFTLTVLVDSMDYYSTSPLKAFDVKGHLGKSATLRCQLRTGRHNRGWFRLTWARIQPDGNPLPFVHLPVRDKIPNWSAHVQPPLKMRMKPMITIQPGHVEFNIRIDNITCQDESEYRCSAVTPQGELLSVAELSIFAGPRPPTITEENHQHKNHNKKKTTRDHRTRHSEDPRRSAHNKHMHLKCEGDVGLPPKMLVWYEKLPTEIYFNIIDNQRGMTEKSDGCHVVRSRTLSIHPDRVQPGTRYRCGYPGYIALPGMYDEIVIEERHVKAISSVEPGTVEDNKRKGDLICQNGNCQIGRSSKKDHNQANRRGPQRIIYVITMFLLIRIMSAV